MGRAFSDDERLAVNERIRHEATELFIRMGIRKTTVRDITAAAGIGEGTFYLYYRSKEEFCIEIISLTAEKVKGSILADIASCSKNPTQVYSRFMERVFHLLDENPLLKMLLTEKGEFDRLMRKVPSECMKKFLFNDDRIVREVLDAFKKAGVNVPVPAETFSGMLRGFYLMTLHRDLIGEEVFEKVTDFIAGAVGTALMKRGKK